MGHTLVSSLIKFYRDFKNSPESFVEEKLDDHFFNVSMVLQDQELGRLFYGMTQQKAKKIDAAMTDSLRNKLFRHPSEKFGTDLAALNIQRGRDHRYSFNSWLCLYTLHSSLVEYLTQVIFGKN